MPTYVLEGAGRAVFPQRPVVLTLSVSGAATTAVMRAMIGSDEDRRAVRPTAGLMILPRIDSPTVLRLFPAIGNEFPYGTTIHLSVAVEDRSDPDPDLAVIGPLDVSGESQVDVASLELSGAGVVISAMRSGADVELGSIASQARIASRAVLGLDQLPERLQFPITVVIDPSASMLLAVQDFSLAVLCDVIAGISSVVSPHEPPRVCFHGPTVRWVDYPSLAEFGKTVHSELSSSYLVAGFRGSIGADLRGPADGLTFIVSDAVPADDPALGTTSDGRHLVVIASPAAVGAIATQHPNATVVPPPLTGTAVDQAAANKDFVTGIVRSLLAGRLVAGRGMDAAVPR